MKPKKIGKSSDMASEWQTLTLAEIYDFSSGLSKPRSEFGTGYPFLSFKDVFYNSAIPKQLTELVQSTDQERARCSIKSLVILFPSFQSPKSITGKWR